MRFVGLLYIVLILSLRFLIAYSRYRTIYI